MMMAAYVGKLCSVREEIYWHVSGISVAIFLSVTIAVTRD